MKTIGTYSFLPFLRQGVANVITAADDGSNLGARASIDVSLNLSGEAVNGGAALTQVVSQQVALYGPGDILGIDTRAIVRTEPRNWITNFESNFLPAIDFYDADFPWRYTPTAPNGARLRPWIALVVLTEDEFKEAKAGATPVPYITVDNPAVFPTASELWAWAHVHFNKSLASDPANLVVTDINALLQSVQTSIGQNPDVAYSRLLCPRRLAESTSYHAFLVPTFETGRLAGLGEKLDNVPSATTSAWESYGSRAQTASFPFYHRWYFRTGDLGDFEYLVHLLSPQPLDPRVGVRDMDVQNPGSNIPGITDPALKGILPLGGALRVPDADLDADSLARRIAYDNWAQPYPHRFQIAIAKFINLADDYATQPAGTANSNANISEPINNYPDPLITAPLYGRWHALTQRLLFKSDGTSVDNSSNWIHELNLDPRFRVPASFGTNVVEANAEAYMNDAWEQIGDVLAVNAQIRRMKLAMEVSARWYVNTLKPFALVQPERAFALTAPVNSRVMMDRRTVLSTRTTSLVPPVYTTAAMRRVIRPAARLMQMLPFNPTVTPQNLLMRVNNGEVSPAPPKTVPTGVQTVGEVAAVAAPPGVPQTILNWLAKFSWLPIAVLIGSIILAILLAVLLFPIGIILGFVIVGVGVFLWQKLKKWQLAGAPQQAIQETNQTPEAVDQLPMSPNFVLSGPNAGVTPTVGTTDSPTAARFKTALRDSFSLLSKSKTISQRPAPVALDFNRVASTVVKKIDPIFTIPQRAMTILKIPDWIRKLIGDDFGEVMAYPRIDLPMYEPLKAISPELLLPNVTLIPDNSITLIETNQKFIESYMVGLNHEFARKLLWREYPTDQRGSYFRQFWDPRTDMDTGQLSADQLREKLYDIPELHNWSLTSSLGTHNNREPTPPERAVLIIRGELLKKYPTAVIYAHHAQWSRDKNGLIDATLPRSLEDIDDAFQDNPPPSVIRTPLYEAKIDPDIYFFGFDLTITEAKGGTTADQDAGWFFVIKERPGEPRFGLEISRDGTLQVTDELTWNDAAPGATSGQFLPAGSLGTINLATVPGTDVEDKTEQHAEDKQICTADVSSARWAYLLFRSPAMVAVHAADMLRIFN